MCGRYQLAAPQEAVRSLFAVPLGEHERPGEPVPPRYNIAPTQPVHVVHAGSRGRALTLMRWGFLPGWVKDPRAFPLIINARVESAADKPAFRNALRRRRALLPATGFYEWHGEKAAKVPHLFEQEGLFALAGIHETWMGPDGEEIDTVAILTGEARGTASRFHERMPLTVPPDAFAAWLDPANDDAAEALMLAQRADYAARPVSTRLSNARNEGAGLMQPDASTAGPKEEAQPLLL